MKIGLIQSSPLHCFIVAIAAIMLLPIVGNAETTKQAGQPSIRWDADTGRAVLSNGRLELVVETHAGINARTFATSAAAKSMPIAITLGSAATISDFRKWTPPP